MPLDEDDPGVGRVDRAEVAPQRVAGDFADRPGHLDPGRPAADDDERQPLARVGSGSRSAPSKAQDPPPDLGRVLDGLQPGAAAPSSCPK